MVAIYEFSKAIYFDNTCILKIKNPINNNIPVISVTTIVPLHLMVYSSANTHNTASPGYITPGQVYD